MSLKGLPFVFVDIVRRQIWGWTVRHSCAQQTVAEEGKGQKVKPEQDMKEVSFKIKQEITKRTWKSNGKHMWTRDTQYTKSPN